MMEAGAPGPLLIVEDNENNRKLARDVLEFRGYRVIEALTAESGIELARSEQPALILMDIRLSGMNGIAAFRALRGDPLTAHIPVVAFTASAMAQDRREIEEQGFDGFVAKPISVDAFVAKIEEVLAARPAPRPQEGPGAE